MKQLFVMAVGILLATASLAQNTKLTVYYQFTGIEDGYDHQCKTQVIIDGKSVGESAVALQSKGGSITVDVPAGNRKLRVVNWALYEGNWEEHTVENNYSIDCTYETSRAFSKPEKLYILFDLDSGTTVSWKKPVKAKKKKK